METKSWQKTKINRDSPGTSDASSNENRKYMESQ